MNKFAHVAVYLFIAAMSFAQSDRGVITGTVTDPAGAVVPNATVTATNLETATVYKVATTTTGDYTIPSVAVGSYQVSVEAPGFEKFVQNGITVNVAQTDRIDVVLKIGSTADTVTITADAALLKTENAEQNTTISSENLLDLPINFTAVAGGGIRNPLSFVQLAPGGWYQPSQPTSSSTNVVRVNGQPNSTYKLLIDGQDATSNNAQNLSGYNPDVEAVEEFTLQTSNFNAEFGQIQGGLFNYTTRSGTNRFHGSLYEYFANTALNAATPYTNVLTAAHKNDFGGSVGGPVWIPKVYNGRNRTFFFFSLERYIDRKQGSVEYTVPTTAMRAGNFSSILTGRTLATIGGVAVPENTIYDPLSDFTASNGLIYRNPFPGNIIPTSRLDPVALKIQAYMPLPQNSSVINNYLSVYPYPADQMIPSIKLDENFGPNSKLSFYMQYYWSHIYSNPGPDGLPIPLTADRYKYPYSYTERINYDYTITPHLLVHIGAGQQRYNNPDHSDPQALDFNQTAELGLVGSQLPLGFPRITGLSGTLGGLSLSVGPSTLQNVYTNKWTAVANTTYVYGDHTFKLGGEWQMNNYSDLDRNGDTGNYAFSAAQTGLPATNGVSLNGGSVGYSYASFLLGAVSSATVNAPFDPLYTKQSWSLFIQDDWKVNRKLTVNYGLRWDLAGQAREIFNQNSNFSPSTPNPSAGGLPGGEIYAGSGPGRCNCEFYSAYPYAVGPRLGVAYQVDPKTVFRGGAGIVYGQSSMYNYPDLLGTVGVGNNQLSFTNPAFDEPALYLQNGLQYNPAALTTVSLNPGVVPYAGQINSPPAYFDRNSARPPRIFQWNLSLQRELNRNLVLEAAYVGNRAAWYEADNLINLNAISTATYAKLGLDITNPATESLLSSTFASGKPQAAGYQIPYPGFPTTLTLAQALRPFPQFGAITVRWAPLGDAWYDSLQTKLTKRYSHGLTAQGAFTWQKELSTADGGTVNDVFNRPNQKAISPFSQPLVLTTGFTYQMQPLPWGSTRLLNKALKDWTIGGVLRYASGLPIPTPTASNTLSSYTFQTTLEDRVPGVPLFLQNLNCGCIDPNKQFVLNPAAWVNPPNGTYGTAAPYYNDFRYQRRPDEELSLSRTFPLREKMSFSVRGEFFNVFNRTQMQNPVATNPQATQVVSATGTTVSGFGMISTASVFNFPRHGQIVARFQW
jgi:hypothetical protein